MYKIEGHINKAVYITNLKTGKKELFYDCSKIRHPKKIVKPVVEQKLNESRRNWHKVTVALKEKNFEEAQLQKHLIEERERALRRERAKNNEVFKPKLFHLEDNTWVYNETKVKTRKKKKKQEPQTESWTDYIKSWIW